MVKRVFAAVAVGCVTGWNVTASGPSKGERAASPAGSSRSPEQRLAAGEGRPQAIVPEAKTTQPVRVDVGGSPERRVIDAVH